MEKITNTESKGAKRLIELSQRLKYGDFFNPLTEKVSYLCSKKLQRSKCISRLCIDIWDEIAWTNNKSRAISYDTLALETGTDIKTARLAVNELIRQVFVAKIESGGGRGNKNYYAILWHPVFANQPYTPLPKPKKENRTKEGSNTPLSQVGKVENKEGANIPIKRGQKTGKRGQVKNYFHVMIRRILP